MAWIKTPEALSKLPELLLRGMYRYTFDGMPLVARGLSFRKRANLFKVGLDDLFRLNHLIALPPLIQVEPSNLCNLKCPLCPTGSGILERPKGVMSMKTFQGILDELEDVLLSVYFFCFGEPFMNRELVRMIGACTDRNILSLTSTNGHFIQTLDEALDLVDRGLSALIIALDGSTQEIYQSYRKGGDIEKVKRCVGNVEEAKAKRGSQIPYTNLRVVVTRDNQEDLPNLEKLARDLGTNMISFKTLGCMTQSEKFSDLEPSIEDMRRFEYDDSSRKKRPSVQCPFPFRQPIVFCDGTVVGCEYDHLLELPYGKIGESSFPGIWNSPQAAKMRRGIRKGSDRPGFCVLCPYQDRVQDSVHLSCTEIRPAIL